MARRPRRKTRVDMSVRPAEERVGGFEEVALGYSPEQAREEARRCLQCKDPICEVGCPVAIPIKEFIGQIAQGDVKGALQTIETTSSLAAVCGRVCPQEDQCEQKCILIKTGQPIAIGRLERFAGDYGRPDGDRPRAGSRPKLICQPRP